MLGSVDGMYLSPRDESSTKSMYFGGISAHVPRLSRIGGALAVAASGLVSIAAAPAPAAPETFIVVLKDGADSRAVAREHSARHQAQVQFVYEHALKGYAARVSSGAIGAIAADGRVAHVERDQRVTINATQPGATWGLDRIDENERPWASDGGYTYAATGQGVKAYIIDTGIRRSHGDIVGRVVEGYYDAFGGTSDDCNGHGTHVAGTVGGTAYGVAKGVTLVAVRVLDCGGGTWSGVIAGIDWAAQDHAPGSPAVANLSLGGGASAAVDQAVKNLIADGVTTAVAAGNGNQAGVAQDACRTSHARVPEAVTISATDRTDSKASFANYGNCVDLFAPGVGITSAWHAGDGATNTINGTSMATPHVAGAAALYLQSKPAATPQQVRDALVANATQGAVKAAKTANNHILYTPPTGAWK